MYVHIPVYKALMVFSLSLSLFSLFPILPSSLSLFSLFPILLPPSPFFPPSLPLSLPLPPSSPLRPSLSPFLPFLFPPPSLSPPLPLFPPPSLPPFTLYIRLCGLATLALVVLATWTTLSLIESHHLRILQNTIQKNWHTCPTPSSSETTQTCFLTCSSKVRVHQIWMHLGELTHSLG